MDFTAPTLENALAHFNQLTDETKPEWGNMSPIGMVEHITDSLYLAQGKFEDVSLQIPEDKVEKAQQFLHSKHPLPKNFKAPFGNPDGDNRNSSLKDAIKEFEDNWKKFEANYAKNPEMKALHPSFGHLGYDDWLQLHSKHLTHHFQQFGLLPS